MVFFFCRVHIFRLEKVFRSFKINLFSTGKCSAGSTTTTTRSKLLTPNRENLEAIGKNTPTFLMVKMIGIHLFGCRIFFMYTNRDLPFSCDVNNRYSSWGFNQELISRPSPRPPDFRPLENRPTVRANRIYRRSLALSKGDRRKRSQFVLFNNTLTAFRFAVNYCAVLS